MANPLVTVVSVFYNRAQEVERSVRSLLDQTYTPLEIIIIDDGSKDDTADRLRAFQDPRLSVRIQRNQGFTKTIDEAVKSARGEFVAIHGSGDVSLPRRIERQAQVLIDNAKVGVVGCFIENENGRKVELRSQASTERPISYHELLNIYPISHGEAMFRKSDFDSVGGYRPFFAYAQDHDLWLRIDRRARFWTVPEVLYVRRRFENAVSADPIKMMFQGYYADFAQQCADSWREGSGDHLDRYGASAILLRSSSKALAKRLNLIAMMELADGDEGKARAVIASNRAQSHSLQTQVIGWLGDLSLKRPELWRAAFKPLLRKVAARRRARNASSGSPEEAPTSATAAKQAAASEAA